MQLITGAGRSNDRNKKQRFAAIVDNTMHLTLTGDNNVAGHNGALLTRCVNLILALPRQDCPSILAAWMDMSGNSLARLDMPGDDHSFRRF